MVPTVVGIDDTAFLHTDGRVVSETTTGGATSQLLADGLGSIRAVTDPTGTVTGTTGYDVFGEATTTGFGSVFGFTGEPTTPSGDVYLRARMYDPGTGRFLSRDTVQPNAPGTQGFNPYTYVANNPTTWTDPTGHTAAAWSAAGLALALAPMLVLLTQHVAAGNTVAGFAGLAGTTTIGTPALALLGLTLGAMAFYCFTHGPCSDILVGLLGTLGDAAPAVWSGIEVDQATTPGDPTPRQRRPLGPIVGGVVAISIGVIIGIGLGSSGAGGDDPPTRSCDPPGPDESETSSLYRAVGPNEAADIRTYRGFRPHPGGSSYDLGKLFATSLEDANRFGQISVSLGGRFTHVAEVLIPRSLVESLEPLWTDGMCALFADIEALSEINRIGRITVTPKP